MTREEAIRIAQGLITDFKGESETMVDFCDMAIKALEQGMVLDKIRAEIIGKDKNVKAVRSDSCCFFTVEEILEIIDKYKAESEDKEVKE